MTGLDSPIPPQMIAEIPKQLQMLVQAQRSTEVATLAAAVVAAMGRPVSVAEVLEIREDLWLSLYADRQSGKFQEWTKTRTERLAKVQS